MARKTCLLASGLLAIVVAGPGCRSPQRGGSDDELHPAWVLAIDAPEEISAADDLVISIRGMAGSDLCHRFERIDVTRESQRVILAGVARFRSHGVCAQAISNFETQLTIPGPFASDLVVVGLRPAGTSVEVPVRVRP